MQFGGQRTDLNLNSIGSPVVIDIRLTPDILPSPEALLISGLSPLDNLKTGISEAEFSGVFNSRMAKPGTIFVGFNNVRFDDEFIRYLNYRNFYDAYSWHWKNLSSRWDLLDVIRMTRALRPGGIDWPMSDEGKPINRLELLTAANNLNHLKAHDALSDALATIEVAKLVKQKQPKLFNYLLSLRKKTALVRLIKENEAIVYTSSHYSSEVLHTTVVAVLVQNEEMGTALVYDLREDANKFLDLSVEELTNMWEYDPARIKPKLPVKTMKLNRCPAVAPLSVLDGAAIMRLKLNMAEIAKNLKLVNENKQEFARKLKKVAECLDEKREKRQPKVKPADERLYDKFISRADANLFPKARISAKENTGPVTFSEVRLNNLLKIYKARNYSDKLTEEETKTWKEYVRTKLFDGEDSAYNGLIANLDELDKLFKDKQKQKLLKDLRIYAKNILDDYGADWTAEDV
jgi:exodeoxyribonuclease-1